MFFILLKNHSRLPKIFFYNSTDVKCTPALTKLNCSCAIFSACQSEQMVHIFVTLLLHYQSHLVTYLAYLKGQEQEKYLTQEKKQGSVNTEQVVYFFNLQSKTNDFLNCCTIDVRLYKMDFAPFRIPTVTRIGQILLAFVVRKKAVMNKFSSNTCAQETILT